MSRFRARRLITLGRRSFAVHLLLDHVVYDPSLLSREYIARLYATEEVLQSSDAARPSSLMASPQAGSVVSMEILVEEDQVSPIWILLKFLRTSVYRPTGASVPEEDVRKSSREFVRHLEECHTVTGSRRTLDRKFVTVKAVKI